MKTALLVALLLAVPAVCQDRTETLMQRLADAAGPPGAEEPVRAIMVPEMKQFATEPLKYDGLGSVIGTQGKSGPRIMIDAHMDELGGMVRRVTPNGFLTMQMLGGWLDQALVDQRWIIIGSKGPVHAVTGIRDIHIVSATERTQVFSRDALYLDIGAKNAAEAAAMGVSVGDPVVPDAPFMVLNGSDNYLGKAWDDRIRLRGAAGGDAQDGGDGAPEYVDLCGYGAGRNWAAGRAVGGADDSSGYWDCDRRGDYGGHGGGAAGGVAGEVGWGAGDVFV